MKVKIIIILAFILIIALFWGHRNYNNGMMKSQSSSTKIRVQASFYPLYFFAGQIGRGKVIVKNITPAGVEPHEYEPTARDLVEIESGDMLILNGNLEGWGEKIKGNLNSKKIMVVEAGQGLFSDKDPHLWLSPKLASKEAEKILDGLAKLDPPNKDYYKVNAAGLFARLADLDRRYHEGLKTCKKKEIITSHAAFSYLSRDYGLNQVSISGLSPEAEPSLKQMAEIAKFARSKNIKYIFFERLVSPKWAETIAHEIGAEILVLNPLEGLTQEDLKKGLDYFTVMEDNLKNIQLALQCAV